MSRWLRKLSSRAIPVGVDGTHAVFRLPGAEGLVQCAHGELADRLDCAGITAVDLVAGADLAVHWVQSAPTAVSGLDELRQVAAARCTQLFGGSPAEWRVGGDWNARRSFVCAALPAPMTAALDRDLLARRIRPNWQTAWAWLVRSRAPLFATDGWSGLRSPHWLQLWRCTGGAVSSIVALRTGPAASAAQLGGLAQSHIAVADARDGPGGASEPLHWLAALAEDLPPGCLRVAPARLAPHDLPRTEAAAAFQLALTR